MLTTSSPSAAARIGGRWAGSLPTFAFASLLPVLGAFVLDMPPLATPAPLSFQLLTTVAQCAAIGATLLIADRTILRPRRSEHVRPLVIVVISATMGLMRIAAAVAMSTLFNHSFAAGVTPVNLILMGLLTGAPILPAIAFFFSTREWYKTERERLIGIDVQLEVRRLQETGAITAMRELAVESLRARFDETRSATLAVLADAETLEPAALASASHALLAAANTTVRPTSHELWAGDTSDYPSISWLDVLQTALRRSPLPTVSALVMFITLISSPLLMLFGTAVTVATLAAFIAVVALVYRLGRSVIERAPQAALPVTIAAAALAGVTSEIFAGIAVDHPVSITRRISVIVLLVAVTVIASIAKASLAAADSTILELRGIVQQTEIEVRALELSHERLNRELATHLHGTVQSGLVAASYAIQDATNRGDVQAMRAAVKSARAALEATLTNTTPGATAALTEVCNSLEARWRGTLAVEWLLPAGAIPPQAAAAVSDLIEECLTNAVIHGQALSARVLVERDRERLVLTVEDDGIGPQGGAPGMGSALMQATTGDDWCIAPTPAGGTVVRAAVAL